jgi:hypothetical protein
LVVIKKMPYLLLQSNKGIMNYKLDLTKTLEISASFTSILGLSSSAKTAKEQDIALTAMVNLAPSDMAQIGVNTCPMATASCRAACLVNSGQRKVNKAVNLAAINRTKLFYGNREFFMTRLVMEISKAKKTAAKKGVPLVVRLNGTSDISPLVWKLQGMNILEIFPDVQFYDYTKVINRFEKVNYPNYHLTYSFTGEEKNFDIVKFTEAGNNVAVVFEGSLPSTFQGIEVIDGDKSDHRFLDKKGVIVGLKYKRVGYMQDNRFENDGKLKKAVTFENFIIPLGDERRG